MADYQLTVTDVVLRTADTVWIPADPNNADFAKYQAWLAAGNTPDPATPVPPPALVLDAGARLSAGVAAALTAAQEARNAIHAIPHNGAVPERLATLLTQLNILTDAFVAMLEAQADAP
jgi:hypothetical protein